MNIVNKSSYRLQDARALAAHAVGCLGYDKTLTTSAIAEVTVRKDRVYVTLNSGEKLVVTAREDVLRVHK